MSLEISTQKDYQEVQEEQGKAENKQETSKNEEKEEKEEGEEAQKTSGDVKETVSGAVNSVLGALEEGEEDKSKGITARDIGPL